MPPPSQSTASPTAPTPPSPSPPSQSRTSSNQSPPSGAEAISCSWTCCWSSRERSPSPGTTIASALPRVPAHCSEGVRVGARPGDRLHARVDPAEQVLEPGCGALERLRLLEHLLRVHPLEGHEAALSPAPAETWSIAA